LDFRSAVALWGTMVVKNRLAYLRQLASQGAKLTTTVSTNPATQIEKVRIIVEPDVKVLQACQCLTFMVLDMLSSACDIYHVADRGHRNSKGASEVVFYISHGKPATSLSPGAAVVVPCEEDVQPTEVTSYNGNGDDDVEANGDTDHHAHAEVKGLKIMLKDQQSKYERIQKDLDECEAVGDGLVDKVKKAKGDTDHHAHAVLSNLKKKLKDQQSKYERIQKDRDECEAVGDALVGKIKKAKGTEGHPTAFLPKYEATDDVVVESSERPVSNIVASAT
jgi:hypothetical protein